MIVDGTLTMGKQQARTRWGTHESVAAFDRKKSSAVLPRLFNQRLVRRGGHRTYSQLAGHPCRKLPANLSATRYSVSSALWICIGSARSIIAGERLAFWSLFRPTQLRLVA